MDFNNERERLRKEKMDDIFAKRNIRFAVYDAMEYAVNDPAKYSNGPAWLDGLEHKWQTGEMLGILSGPGVGKTSLSLHIAKEVLLNNSEDSYVAFISLEMEYSEIMEKWLKVTTDNPEIRGNLIIVDNYNEDGTCKSMTVADIKLDLKIIQENIQGKIKVVILDHLHEINNQGQSDYNKVCEELRNMTKELEVFTIVQSQTTKEKGLGDVPVPRNGCYGTSRFENLMTYIVTIFQPLRRVQNECNLPALGWQYCKIRFKSKNDRIKEEVNYVKKFNFDKEDLENLTPNEVTEFSMYYEKVLELRESEEKKKAYAFDLSTTIRGKDGREVKLTKIIGGREES